MLRIASWNCEGLTPEKLQRATEHLGAIDVLCLQEVRRQPAELPGFVLASSLMRSGAKRYGVATYARRTHAPIVVANERWDDEGRCVLVVLPHWRLAIVNVYAVNGTSAERHAWKRRFHEHIAEMGQTIRAEGVDLLLIGDWNVSQAAIDTTPRLRTGDEHVRSRAHFQSALVEPLDVVDVFRELHPKARAYTWFDLRARARGELDAARVDFALLARSRLEQLRRAEIDEGALDALGSDHAPLLVELLKSECASA